MFACKFELPDNFGARVTATHEHVKEALASEGNRSRREALRKALFEACSLLRDVSRGAVAYELSRILDRIPPLREVPPPPIELEQFLELEKDLLRQAGISESAVEDIEQLIREVHESFDQPLRAENIVLQINKLKDRTCSLSRNAADEAQGIRTRSIWWGVAGTALVVVNAGALTIAPPAAAISSAFGGAILGKALSDN